MKIYIVIPAHNEAAFIAKTLHSLLQQDLLPKKIVVVDDQSTDETAEIVSAISKKNPIVSLVKTDSSGVHLPGSKVINAFYKGFKTLDDKYDIICKFDADLIFPENYLSTISSHFQKNKKAGIVGGFCSILKNDKWALENLTGKDHIRGALKAYRKECFLQIGKLKPSMGWDTVDELLAQYHRWEIITDENLIVKHLKPTGFNYDKTAKLKQGEAFYKLRYGFIISFIASLKLTIKKGDIKLMKNYLQGFFSAKSKKSPFLVSKKEGAFIRRLRYKKMISKIF